MPKFGLYTMSGDYLSVSSTSLEKIEKIAVGYSFNVQIGETYLARSPWNPKKMTEHVNLFKTIRNERQVCEGFK